MSLRRLLKDSGKGAEVKKEEKGFVAKERTVLWIDDRVRFSSAGRHGGGACGASERARVRETCRHCSPRISWLAL